MKKIDENTIAVLDYGYVRHLGHYGNDRTITAAARVSYGASNKLPKEDKRLLKYLFTHRHTSPFEQCSIQFNIRMPIFVMRQFVRHRTFKLNEFSARYKQLPDLFYIPNKMRGTHKINKQGSTESDEINHDQCRSLMIRSNADAYESYKELIEKGVANELARLVLPTSVYTEIHVVCDLHNLLHFLYLRTDPHAQWEIQQFALAMQEITEQLFPWTTELFKKYVPKMVDREEWTRFQSWMDEPC